MPDVAYLLHALGMTRDVRAVPVWQRVPDRLRESLTPTCGYFEERHAYLELVIGRALARCGKA